MAFGFPAYHEETVTLPQPVTHDWIAYGCAHAGFSRPFYSADARGAIWRCSSSISLASWGDEISITWVAQNAVHIRSQCGMPTQCIDWGRNTTNVRKFVTTLVTAMQGPGAIYR
jgi:hypothetical protein